METDKCSLCANYPCNKDKENKENSNGCNDTFAPCEGC